MVWLTPSVLFWLPWERSWSVRDAEATESDSDRRTWWATQRLVATGKRGDTSGISRDRSVRSTHERRNLGDHLLAQVNVLLGANGEVRHAWLRHLERVQLD